MKSCIWILTLSLGMLFFSCRENKVTGVVMTQGNHKEEKNDPLLRGNQRIVEKEEESIQLFIKRYGWNMEDTGTGLRFQSVKEGEGEVIKPRQLVTLNYTTMLLNGEQVYSSKELGPKKLVVDKSDEIAGLHEAVKRMKKGGEAYLVIPSHLAYGIPGDGDKIPLRVPIAMKIKIVEVEDVK